MESASVELVETGAKRDARGRVIESEAEKARLLAQYDRSGLTQRAFARREGIRYNTFIWWLKQRRDQGRRGAEPSQPSIKFAEYRLAGPAPVPSTPPLEVNLPDGTTLRGGTASELVKLIKALRG